MGDFKLSSIEDAIKDFKDGHFVIVVDDEDRENEGAATQHALRTYHALTLRRTGPAAPGQRQHLNARNTIHRDR